jgi:hypothetical protein
VAKFAATDFDITIAALTSVTALLHSHWTSPGNSLRLPLLVIQHAATCRGPSGLQRDPQLPPGLRGWFR